MLVDETPVEVIFPEVPLVRKSRRQGRFACLGRGLAVDPRRWQRDGWWRRSLRNRLLALGFALGLSPWRLARRYGAGGAPERKA
ncbi:hypothetical protein [Stutzerimonas tarimensis]|uniref:Uncharacterized protein n=1 Tax=Stutzerimonas tarimensis TaxID=1507735 RepID=A0ABV7T9A2_9GAMM